MSTTMVRISANLGFLWPELSLTRSIVRAGEAGFDGVECHWPYDVDPIAVRAALAATAFEMVSINTRQGVNGPADFGVNALPGREDEARAYLDEAIAYAAAIGARNINAPAGKSGGSSAAEETYRRNLRYGARRAADHGIGILVEPVNQRDAPGYHVSTVEGAVRIVRSVDEPNVKVLFDCYHAQISQGDLLTRLREHLPAVGHVQIAGVPARHEPDEGEIAYGAIFAALDEAGWSGYVGAEYRPASDTDAGLGWLPNRHRGAA